MKNFSIDAHPHDYPSRELVERCICSVEKHFHFADVVGAKAIAPGCRLLALDVDASVANNPKQYSLLCFTSGMLM
jgi:hypothetical protein